MLKLIKSSLKSIINNIFTSLVLFVLSIIGVSLAIQGVGVLTVPIDRAMDISASKNHNNKSDDVGILFIMKKIGVPSSSTEVSLEINEISNARIFSGIGSALPLKNGSGAVVKPRYVRIEGVPLPNNDRSDYAIIGESAGGKVSGAVLIGHDKAAGCVLLTYMEFCILCICLFVFGGGVVGFISYYMVVSKHNDVH